MAWINEEYAAEIAVLSTWIAFFVPWTVSFTGSGPWGSHLYFLRFPAFELQVRYPSNITINGTPHDVAGDLQSVYGGGTLFGDVFVGLPPLSTPGAAGLSSGAYGLWTLAALLVTGAFVLSIGMYLREDAVSAWLPYDYVRLTAGIFGLASVFLAGAAVLFYLTEVPYGVPIPVGLVLIAALAVLLWRAERVDGDEEPSTRSAP